MRLDVALVHHKLCDSRKEAQELIKGGAVYVDGVQVIKQTKDVDDNSLLTVTKRREFVSRGGEKLKGALLDLYGDEESVKKALEGKRAIDIGSSTGGFTDCLIRFGISTVTCVDVGSNQIHPKVSSYPNVTVYENTDIRNFDSEIFDMIVADLSFISLQSILDKILSFGGDKSTFFLLVKPQFEVGKGNTKKGIVKDVKMVEEIITEYESIIKQKFPNRIVQVFKSKLPGGDGNQEYFLTVC